MVKYSQEETQPHLFKLGGTWLLNQVKQNQLIMKKAYPDQDINDLVADDMDPDTFYKGRGPDKQKRKSKGSGSHNKHETYKNHRIEMTGGSYTRTSESGQSVTDKTPHTEEHHVTLPNGSPYHTTFSSREHARAHVDKLTKSED